MKRIFFLAMLVSISFLSAMQPQKLTLGEYKEYCRTQLLASLDHVLREHYQNNIDSHDETAPTIGRYIQRVSEIAWQEYSTENKVQAKALDHAVTLIPRDPSEAYWLGTGIVADDIFGTGESPKTGKPWWDRVSGKMKEHLLFKYESFCKKRALASLDIVLERHYAQNPSDKNSQVIDRYLTEVATFAKHCRLEKGRASEDALASALEDVPTSGHSEHWIYTGKKSSRLFTSDVRGREAWNKKCVEMIDEIINGPRPKAPKGSDDDVSSSDEERPARSPRVMLSIPEEPDGVDSSDEDEAPLPRREFSLPADEMLQRPVITEDTSWSCNVI